MDLPKLVGVSGDVAFSRLRRLTGIPRLGYRAVIVPELDFRSHCRSEITVINIEYRRIFIGGAFCTCGSERISFGPADAWSVMALPR